MRYKRAVVILTATVIIFLSLLCFFSLFKIADVYCDFTVFAVDEADSAKELVNTYKGKNLLFLSVNDVEKELSKKSGLKVVSVEKRYPNALYIELSVKPELFAIKATEGYYIIDEFYEVVEKRDNILSPSEGIDNIILEIDYSGVNTDLLLPGQDLTASYQNLVLPLKNTISAIDFPRDKIKAIRLFNDGNGDITITLNMREGVKIEIWSAFENAAEKATKAYNLYKSLTDYERLTNTVLAYKIIDGDIVAVYTKNAS